MCVPYQFASVPRLRSDQCPLGNLLVYAATLKELDILFFFVFLLFSYRCRCTSTSRSFDLRTFHAEVYCLPSFFGFPEVTAVLCVLGIFPLEHDWFSIDRIQFKILRKLREPLNFVLPRVCRGYSVILPGQSTESEKPKSVAVLSLTARSFKKALLNFGIVLQLIADILFQIWTLIQDQFL